MSNTAAWGNLLQDFSKLPKGDATKPGFLLFPDPTKPQSKENPLELHGVDLRYLENTKFHGTATKVMKDANIVLRRGNPFFLDLLLHREFEIDTDVVKIEFDWEKKDAQKETVILPLEESNKFETESKHWKAKITSHHDHTVFIRVDIPQETHHGLWHMKIMTNTKDKLQVNEQSVVVKGIYFCV